MSRPRLGPLVSGPCRLRWLSQLSLSLARAFSIRLSGRERIARPSMRRPCLRRSGLCHPRLRPASAPPASAPPASVPLAPARPHPRPLCATHVRGAPTGRRRTRAYAPICWHDRAWHFDRHRQALRDDLAAGGTAEVKIELASAGRFTVDSGPWWIAPDGRFCIHYTRFAGGNRVCRELVVEDGVIKAYTWDHQPNPWVFKK